MREAKSSWLDQRSETPTQHLRKAQALYSATGKYRGPLGRNMRGSPLVKIVARGSISFGSKGGIRPTSYVGVFRAMSRAAAVRQD